MQATPHSKILFFIVAILPMQKSMKIVFDDGISALLNHILTVYAVPLRPVLNSYENRNYSKEENTMFLIFLVYSVVPVFMRWFMMRSVSSFSGSLTM